MQLKQLTDEALRANTKRWVQQEREVLTTILHHLREVEKRRLFSKLKFTSLFDYAVKELKYHEMEACRRISAMRLLRDIPEIEDKIADGSLSLSNLALAQTLFSRERKAGRPLGKDDKREVLARIENLSSRAAEKVVKSLSPEMNRTRDLSFEDIEDDELREKLLRLKGKYAHANPNMSLTELLHKLCDSALVEKSPSAQRVVSDTHSVQESSQAAIRRAVWIRDKRKCTNCDSTYALEIDHVIPKAAGGASTLENMRLLCRSCNQRAAIEFFGNAKMGKHLRCIQENYAV